MCYNVEAKTKNALEYASLRVTSQYAEELERLLSELLSTQVPQYHVSGFAHPQILCFTNEAPYIPATMTWGLIPNWIKTPTDAKKIRTQTLNARGETIFEKPAFRNSAKNKRCLIYIDAFYEHHHANKQTYPFRITKADHSPMILAGLWEDWVDKDTGEILKTCSIVTTSGNDLMAKIHNNPKAEMGPRMPVILTQETQDQWLQDCKTESDKTHLQSLIKPINPEHLIAHTVGRLQGKTALGNVPEVRNPVNYEDLILKLVD